MNPDLKRERKGASFDVRLMTHLLDGGAEETARRERFQKLVADEPVFANDDKYFLSRVQNYERVLQKVVRGIQMCIEHNITPEDAEYLFHFIGEEFMVGLHWSMFIPTLQGQATDDQVSSSIFSILIRSRYSLLHPISIHFFHLKSINHHGRF